ncbi:APC family permease [Anoxybacteroides amylolyticum]|uniref:Serine/threonine exchanger SteT n=1 Tax=Anoxybacteroides amylolyticum TaxID=294699 RepID=A0A160F6C0_9BACL|nr:amino acid permease [Anoxybacillus amylolyticus]ANB62056.1 serine/threonine exchanger SteT [Anoxybacillus amylolyticus]
MEKDMQLKRNIGFFVSTSLVIGTVIGSGIFMKPGVVLSATGNSNMALLAWVIGGIITLASGLTMAEVSVNIPKTGGLYTYIEEVYGKTWGFLCGWVQTVVYGPAVIGALGLYFGTLMADFFNFPENSNIIIGIFTVILLALLNMLGTHLGGFVQTASTIGKLIPIVLIATFGLLKGNAAVFNVESSSVQHMSMGAAILATLWAYDGWMNVGFMAGEMKNPAKNLPRAIISGLFIVIIAYLSVNIALLHVLPAQKIVALGPNAASTAAALLFGEVGGKILAVGILISIFGCLNGKILTFPRVPFAMAERGLLPGAKIFSCIHPTLKTPTGATVLQVAIALLMMVFWNPDRLTDMAIFAVMLFYGMSFYAVFLLRKHGKYGDDLYKVPLYPLTPIVAIVGTAYIIVSTLMYSPTDAVFSFVIMFIGLPVYWKMKGKNHSVANRKVS